MRVKTLIFHLCILSLTVPVRMQLVRKVGRLQEVFAWKQITFNIGGNLVLQDRFGDDLDDVDNTRDRVRRQSDTVFFENNEEEPVRNWNQPASRAPKRAAHSPVTVATSYKPSSSAPQTNQRPSQQPSRRPRPNSQPTTTTVSPNDEAGRFFVQYNNLPMGVERVGDRLFVTLPRRRYGIPSTLNYLDLTRDSNERSPSLRPYPNLRMSRSLTSVYRTRADECGRLWMVDTGMLEIPNNRQQLQPPAIVVYDLNTDRQIMRYPFKSSDIPAENTPTGLASITVDITNGDCSNAYAYVPDLATYGLIVYSLADNDSWRLTHNYFSFNPTAGNLRIAGQRFQWNDGIFSLTLAASMGDGCKLAYFHPMVSTQEFSVSTCVLKNRTASSADDYWSRFSLVGDRGANSQSTMHGYHAGSQVVFFADIGRDAVSCWHTGSVLSPESVQILAKDSRTLSYPSDIHVTGDELWVMANSLPTFAYSRLDTNEFNFYIYKANIQDLISGTVCGLGRPGARQNDLE